MVKVAAIVVGVVCAVALVVVAVTSLAAPSPSSAANDPTVTVGVGGDPTAVSAGDDVSVAVGQDVAAGWSERETVRFAQLIAKLEQQAFYATDGSFLGGVAAPEAIDQIAKSLALRVEGQRWDLAGTDGNVWYVTAALAASTPVVESERVELSVWVHGVFNRADGPHPEARYWVETAELQLLDGQWLLVGLEEPGDAPQAMLPLAVEPSTSAETDVRLGAYRLLPDPIWAGD